MSKDRVRGGGRGKEGGGQRSGRLTADTLKAEGEKPKEKKDDRKRRVGGGKEDSGRGSGGEEQARSHNAGKSRHGNDRPQREGGGAGPRQSKEESSKLRESGGRLSSGSMGAFPRPHGKEPGAPISEELQERERVKRAMAEEKRARSEGEGGGGGGEIEGSSVVQVSWGEHEGVRDCSLPSSFLASLSRCWRYQRKTTAMTRMVLK